MIEFILNNKVEIAGAILGLLFLYLEIKENKWLWPIGLLTSAMYIYVFFVAKLYADMSLQLYYVVASIYGWVLWARNNTETHEAVFIVRLTKKLFVYLTIVTILVYIVIAYILVNYTDGDIPYWDAFTTALGIVATWMLAKKILEQWLLWIIANAVSLVLYIYKGLYPTAILYLFYTSLAVVGYYQWRNTHKKQEIQINYE